MEDVLRLKYHQLKGMSKNDMIQRSLEQFQENFVLR